MRFLSNEEAAFSALISVIVWLLLVSRHPFALASQLRTNGNVTSNRVPPLPEMGLMQATSPERSITRR
jgi:hypothetical protein